MTTVLIDTWFAFDNILYISLLVRKIRSLRFRGLIVKNRCLNAYFIALRKIKTGAETITIYQWGGR